MKQASRIFQRGYIATGIRLMAVAVAGATCDQANAGVTPPGYSWQWATIGAPGNRPTIPSEMPLEPERQVGAVPYAYRIATTEVTVSQWYEFVQAYAPYVGADFGRDTFRGDGILFAGFGAGGVPQYTINPELSNSPTTCGWRYAARFCNWLVHSKASDYAAFQTGAYDTSTFGQYTRPEGFPFYTDQAYHTPGASFWIPSQDEWVKAAYYDRNRYGPGQGGYWMYPNASSVPLVGGFPGVPGAQTSAPLKFGPGYPIPVGAYPDVNLPWGLLDVSGGEREWTEGWSPYGPSNYSREVRGSQGGFGEFSYLFDSIDAYFTDGPTGGSIGLRLASLVPSCSSLAVFAVGGTWLKLSSRRRAE